MNDIGIYICNYNGKKWVVECIHSLLKQSIKSFDIYVVDNASSDGTVEEVKTVFGEKILFLCNKTNIGGSGGFDRGLQDALRKGYPYIVLLDNDVLLDPYALENMKQYLETHNDVGIVGAKVMIMDKPNMVQDFGARLDFINFRETPEYTWQKDDGELPEINECDYVPTCAVMVRADALKETGTMPVENFIYYDDIELSYKMKRKGWRVAALGNAKVWHKGGFNKVSVNTFPKYYFLRNRLYFFAKYVGEQEIERFIDYMLSEVFALLYGYYNKGMHELLWTTIFAFDDFIHLNFGKAEDDKILQIQDRKIPFDRITADKARIEIAMIDNFRPEDELDIFHILLYIIGKIQVKTPRETIWVSLDGCGYSQQEFFENWGRTVEMDHPLFVVPELVISEDVREFDLRMRLCQHVRLVSVPVLPVVYVDQYCNCITSEQDYAYFKGYETNEAFFKGIYRPLMERSVRKIRELMEDHGE